MSDICTFECKGRNRFECKGRNRFFVDLFSQAAEATAPAEAEKADTSPFARSSVV